MIGSRSLLVPFWMFLLLVFCGCGGSGGSTEVSAFSPASGATPPTTLATATVELRSELAQTTIPVEVASLQAMGYDQGRVLRYGPVSQEKSSVVAWTEVPVEVTNFVIEYLDANGQIMGLAQVSVQLSQGQTLVVDNPTILGVSSTLKELTITPATRTIALGSSTQFSALGTFTDGSTLDLTSAVSWSVEDPSIARANQGRVEGLDIGSSSVVASFAEVSAQASITVSDATLESLELSPESPAIAQGTSQAFTAEGFFSDGSSQDLTADVDWASSEPQVATIESGAAQGLQAGQTHISATFGQEQASTVLTVTSATLESLAVSGGAGTIALGTSTEFIALGTFSDGTTQDLSSSATWGITPPDRGAVDRGRVTGLSEGSAKVVATLAGVSGQANLAVTSATLESLELSPRSPAIAQGTSQAFTVEGFFSDGSSQDLTTDVNWASSEPQVATIENGAAQGLQAGQTHISATFGQERASTVLTVTSATLESLAVSGGATTIALGGSTQFSALGTFSDGSTLDLTAAASWSVEDPSVARVSLGRVQGLDTGSTSVIASFAEVSTQASISVSDATLESLELSPRSPAIAQGTSQDFTVEGFFSDGSSRDLTADVDWASSEPQVATIENGAAQGLQAGQTHIRATFGQRQASTVLTVTSATLESLAVSGGSGTIALGTSTEFVAMGTFSDGSIQDLSSLAAWQVSPPERAGVDRGRVTGLTAGPASVTATLAGVSDQVALQVTDAVVTSLRVETVDGGGSTLVNVEQALELRALATLSDGSQQDVTADATWTSEDGSRATVDAGVVTGEQAGQTFINASLGGQSGELQVTVQIAPLPQLVLSGATFTFNTDTGVLSPQVGDSSTAPGWNSSEGRLVVRSFIVESGSTLNVVGDRTFRVKAETNIRIAGELSFQGQNGANGTGGGDGSDGQDGGDIALFSSGDLTVTGTITVNGGDGGNGGGLNIPFNLSVVQAGSGGRGGDSGEIVLTAGDNLDIDSGELSRIGGPGGNGGNVSIESNSSSTPTSPVSATGGTGGDGGLGGSRGGDGGNGGNVNIGVNQSSANGGAGGSGGDGGSEGGDGGNGGSVTVTTGGSGSTSGGAGGAGGQPGGNPGSDG